MTNALLVSCAFITTSLLVAELLRKVVNALFTAPLSRLLCLEFIAAAELCSVCFELIIVTEAYGIWMYALFLFLLTIWWANHWQDAAGCPYIHVESYLDGSSSLSQAILCCLAEVAGGVAIYKYVQTVWSLKLSDQYTDKDVWDCDADLQVPVMTGALIEGAATFLCRIVSRMISEIEPRFGGAIDALVGTSLVLAAFDHSGGYFNPVLATSLKLHCRGHTDMEHFIVYWIGATAGSVVSWLIYKPLISGSLLAKLREEPKTSVTKTKSD